MKYILSGCFVVLAVASSAHAQLVEAPPRVSRPAPPPDTGRTTQAVGLGVNMFGGYHTNHVPTLDPQAPDVQIRPSSYTGTAAATLSYSVGNGSRSLSVSGLGRANAYSGYGSASSQEGPYYSGDVQATGATGLGRSTSLSASQTVSRAPYISMGLFSGFPGLGGGVAYDPEGNPVNALIDGTTWSMNTSVAVGHQWSRRLGTNFTYSYVRKEHEGASPLSQSDHIGGVNLTGQVFRSASVAASYSVTERDMQQLGQLRNDLVHNVTGTFAMGRNLSRTRALSFSIGGGGQLNDYGAQQTWSPTLFGTFALDVARSWSVSANYRRTSKVVNSPLFGPDDYLSQAVIVSTGGNLGDRFGLVFSAGYTTGTLSVGRLITGVPGDYDGYTGAAQLNSNLGAGWTMVTTVSHYKSTLGGAAASQLLLGSGELSRTSAQLGFAWSMPLYGSARRGRN